MSCDICLSHPKVSLGSPFQQQPKLLPASYQVTQLPAVARSLWTGQRSGVKYKMFNSDAVTR